MKNKNTKGFNLLSKGRVAIPIVLITIVLVLSFLLSNLRNEERNIGKVKEDQEALVGIKYVNLSDLTTERNNQLMTSESVILVADEDDILQVTVKRKDESGNWVEYTSGSSTYSFILGDVNEDGTVNMHDAVRIWNYKAGNVTLSEKQLEMADVDDNGVIDKEDILTILYGTTELEDGYLLGNPIKSSGEVYNGDVYNYIYASDARAALRIASGLSNDNVTNDLDTEVNSTLNSAENKEATVDQYISSWAQSSGEGGSSSQYQDYQKMLSDVNMDFEVTSEDARNILRISARLNTLSIRASDFNEYRSKWATNRTMSLPQIVIDGEYAVIIEKVDGSRETKYFTIDSVRPSIIEDGISKDIEGPTNGNVIVTIKFDEPVKTAVDDEYSTEKRVIITDNGTIDITFYDRAGNWVNVPITIDNIDHINPEVEAFVRGDLEKSQEVEVGIIVRDFGSKPKEVYINGDKVPTEEGDFSADGTKLEVTVKVEESGTYVITANDNAGNSSTTSIEVENIDTISPSYAVTYNTIRPTNGKVVATIYFSEQVKKQGTTEFKYIHTEEFSSNENRELKYVDKAGNEVNIGLNVDWIDKTVPSAPTVTKTPSQSEWTNGDVILNIKATEEDIAFIKVNGGVISTQKTGNDGVDYIATENGTYTIEVIDKAGNTRSQTVVVSNIDKIKPEVAVHVSESLAPSKEVIIKVIARDYESKYKTITCNGELINSSSVDILEEGNKIEATVTVTQNRDYVITVEDNAGNRKSEVVRVENVDNTAPVATIEYSELGPTKNDVTATITFSELVSKEDEDTYNTVFTEEFSANETKNITFKDQAGNLSEVQLQVNNIDKTAPNTPVVTGNSDAWTNQNIELQITAQDNTNGLGISQIKVNGSVIANNSATGSYIVVENGEYTVEAIDKAGNVSSTIVTVDKIDKIEPEVAVHVYTTLSPSKVVTIKAIARDYESQYKAITCNGETIGSDSIEILENGNKIEAIKTVTENGDYVITVEDNAGNKKTEVIRVENVDNTLPVATIEYSELGPTKNDVTATITFSELVSRREENTYNKVFTEVFTANGTREITFKDQAGNEITVTVMVDNIDKTAPNITEITGNPDDWTNENVTLEITTEDDTAGSGIGQIKVNGSVIANNSTTGSYTVVENGEYTVEAIDKAGNITSTVVNVSKIDKTIPEVSAHISESLAPSQEVTIKVIARDYQSQIKAVTCNGETIDSDSIQTFEDGNKIEVTKTVTQNRDYVITVEDNAGNKNTQIVRVENVDNIAPVATIEYSELGPTKNDVTATITFSELVSKSNENAYNKVFTEVFTANDTREITFKDQAGNEMTVTVTVENIDEIAPNTPVVTGNPDEWTNESVTLEITTEDDTEGSGIDQIKVNGSVIANKTTTGSYTVVENGEYTIEAIDKAGNIVSTTISVNKIDKVAPIVNVDNPDFRASKNVTLTIDVFDTLSGINIVKVGDETINPDENGIYKKTINNNGTYIITVEDNAGNITTITETIQNIDSSIPNVTIQSAGTRHILSNNAKSKISANLHAYDEDGILNISYIWSYVKNEEIKYIDANGVEQTLAESATDEDGNVLTSANILTKLDENSKWTEAISTTQDELVLNQEFTSAGIYVLFVKAKDRAGNEYTTYKEYEVIDNEEPIVTITYKAGVDGEETEDLSSFNDNLITEPITIKISYDSAVKSKEVSFDNKTYYNSNELVINKNGTLIVTSKDCNNNTYIETIEINKINENRPIVSINEISRDKSNNKITYELQWNKEDIDFTTNNIIVRNAEKEQFNTEETAEGTKATLIVNYSNYIKNTEVKDVEILVRAEDSLDVESYIAYYSSRVDRKIPELQKISVTATKNITLDSNISRTKTYYNNEETVTIKATFNENIDFVEDKDTILNISFNGKDSKIEVEDPSIINGNEIIWTYAIQPEDNGQIKIEEINLEVQDEQGNVLVINEIGNVNVSTIIADTNLPYVTKVELATTNGKTSLKNGDIITIVVNLNEPVYKRNVDNIEITEAPSFKFKLGENTRTLTNGIVSADYKKITYTYTINNDAGAVIFLKENEESSNTFGNYEGNSISDIAGNKFTIANNEANNYEVFLNGKKVTDTGNIDITADTTVMTIESITMTNSNGHEEYQTGDRINIAVNFSEELYTFEGELLVDAINDEILYEILDANMNQTIGYIIKHADTETANRIKNGLSSYIPELTLDIDGNSIADEVIFEDIINQNGKTVIKYSYTIKYEDFGGIEIKSLIASSSENKVYDKAQNETYINYVGTDFKYYENGEQVSDAGEIRVNRVKAPFIKYIVKVPITAANGTETYVAIDPTDENVFKKDERFIVIAGFDGAVYADSSKQTRITENYYPLPLRMEGVEDIPNVLENNGTNTTNGNVNAYIGKDRASGIDTHKNTTISYVYEVKDTYTYSNQNGKMEIDISDINAGVYFSNNAENKTIYNYKNNNKQIGYSMLEELPIGIDTILPTISIIDNNENTKDLIDNSTFIDMVELEINDTDISSWKIEKETIISDESIWYVYRTGTENTTLGIISSPGKYRVTLTDKVENNTVYTFEIISSSTIKSEIINNYDYPNIEEDPINQNAPIKFIKGFNKYSDNVHTRETVEISLVEANGKLNGTEQENNSIVLENGIKIKSVKYVDVDVRRALIENPNYQPNYTDINFGTSIEIGVLDSTTDYTIKVTLIDGAGNEHEIYYYLTIDQEKPEIEVEVELYDTTLKNNADIYKEGTKLYIQVASTESLYMQDETVEIRNRVIAPRLKVFFGDEENEKEGTSSNGYAVNQSSSYSYYTYVYTIGKDDNGPIRLEFDSLDVYDEAGNMINLLENSITENPEVTFDYNEIKADTELPTLDITLYDGTEEITTGYTNKDNITVKFNWSESVTGFDMSDVSVSGGTLGNFNKISENEYTANLDTASIQNGSLRIVVEHDSARDIAGNYNVRKEITLIKDKEAPVLQDITAYAVEPYQINVDTTVSTYKEYYKPGEQIIIEAVFNEKLSSMEELPTLNLKFGNENTKAIVSNGELSENKIIYTYTIAEGDKGVLSIGRFSGIVEDLAGNSLRVGNKNLDGDIIIADTEKPKLESINIDTGNKTDIKAGDPVKIELLYSEYVYGLDLNTVKPLTGELISSTIFTILEENGIQVQGNKVTYEAVINESVNSILNTVEYNGIVHDIAGNAFEATALPEDTKIFINGVEIDREDENVGIIVDTLAPTKDSEEEITINVLADVSGTAPYYKAGTNLEIKVKLSEDVTIIEGTETNGVRIDPIEESQLYFGEQEAIGTLIYDAYDEENRTLIFKYIIESQDNGDLKLVIPENSIKDAAGNLNSEIIIETQDQLVADTEQPEVTLQKSLDLTEAMNTFNVTAIFSEDLYNVVNNIRQPLTTANAPKLIYTYNNERKDVEAASINGNIIVYTFRIESDHEIATTEVETNGFTGTAYDRAGNGYNADKTSLFIKTIEIEPANSELKNEYNKYKAGTEIKIDIEFNKVITSSRTEALMEIKFGEATKVLTGTVTGNRIIFNYTIENIDNGRLQINGISGVVKDPNSNETYALNNVSLSGLLGDVIIADTIKPMLTITAENIQNSITNADTIIYKIKWSEDVIGFTKEDITVQNGTIINYRYNEELDEATVEVLKLNDGKQIVFVIENACEDQAGNKNIRSDITNITIDTVAPTIRALINGGNYVIDSRTGKSKISTRLEINEEISKLKYKWSKEANNTDMSDAVEMDLSELDINDIPLEKEIEQAGVWYLYMSATDIAGNTRNVRSKGFDVRVSTITITPSTTAKTNQDVIATVTYGDYLTEDRLVRVGEQGSADPTKITVKENGNVYAEATDGNGNKVIANYKIENIFKTPPTVEVTAEESLENVVIIVEVIDGGAGIKTVTLTDSNGETIEQDEEEQEVVEEAKETKEAEQYTFTVIEDGTYKVTVEDEAGNKVEKEIQVEKEILEITTTYDIIESKYIKVSEGTTVAEIIEGIVIKNPAEANVKKEVYDGENIHEEGKLKTGETIKLNDNLKEYIIIVNGDVTCDGNVNLDDVFRANTYRINASTSQIDTLYRLATDADNNNNIDIFDIFRINTIRLSK